MRVKVYSTKLEKQVAWMRSTDYDASKPIPAELVASKPVVTSISSAPRNNGKPDRDMDDDRSDVDADDYESMSHSRHVMDSDDEVRSLLYSN